MTDRSGCPCSCSRTSSGGVVDGRWQAGAPIAEVASWSSSVICRPLNAVGTRSAGVTQLGREGPVGGEGRCRRNRPARGREHRRGCGCGSNSRSCPVAAAHGGHHGTVRHMMLLRVGLLPPSGRTVVSERDCGAAQGWRCAMARKSTESQTCPRSRAGGSRTTRHGMLWTGR